MSFDLFALLLLIDSVITSLITEAIKILLSERDITYYSNAMVCGISFVVSLFLTISYCILNTIPFDASMCIYSIAIIVMGALCAMLGYDKVIQAIRQIKE